jgi:hypothetical protein
MEHPALRLVAQVDAKIRLHLREPDDRFFVGTMDLLRLTGFAIGANVS